MVDTQAAGSTPAREACSPTPHPRSGSSPPPQTVAAEPQSASDDDDDDRFNKSLDEFDIPPVKDADRWSGDDCDEEEDDHDDKSRRGTPDRACEASAARKRSGDSSGGKVQQQKTSPRAEKGSQESLTRLASKAQSGEDDASAVPQEAAGLNSEDTHQPSTDHTRGAAPDSIVRRRKDAGVMLVLSLEDELTTRFRLFLRHSNNKTPAAGPTTEQQAAEREGDQTPGDTERTKRQDNRGEELPLTDGSDVEDGKPAEESETDRSVRKGHKKSGQESAGERGQRRHGEQQTPQVKEHVPEAAEKTGKGEGGREKDHGDDDDQGFDEEYIEVQADEIPETLDEQWFQKQLKELPTLFAHRRVHQLTEARYKANLTMLKNVGVRSANAADSDDDFDDTADQRIAHLLESSRGDYDSVLTYTRNSGTTMTDRRPERKASVRCIESRSGAGDNLFVVLKWLLGKRLEAERVARHLVRKLPFSLVSLSNLFFIMWRKGEREQAAQLLSHFVTLKKCRPDIYEAIQCEEQAELSWCYTELDPEFIPDALAIYEVVVPKKPHCHYLKLNWALNLRRLTNDRHNLNRPLQDVATPLLKATELLLELIQDAKVPETKAAAAAELGEILNGCRFDKEKMAVVVQRAEDAGLNMSKCFDIVMQVEDKGGSNLIRAGKYFRYSGELHKSEKALKKAVSVQDSAKAHHQFALTLKKLAVQEKRRAFQNRQRGPRRPVVSQIGHRRGASRQNRGVISWARCSAGDSNMNSLSISMKSVMYQSFSREDRYVKETMYHLKKTLMLSHGENAIASYDLGLMYKALREYSGAMEQFLMITEVKMKTAEVVTAFEQSGLVKLEQCSLEENESRARALEEEGQSLLTMAVLIQSRIVQAFRETDTSHAVWTSCYTLGQYLQLQQEVEGVFEEDSPVEVWLLRLLRVYADNLPVLTSLQQLTARDRNPQVLMDRLHKYLRDQRHEDIILFTHLLRLTQQGQTMTTDYARLTLKALVLVARAKLMTDVRAGLVGSSTFNSSMAKRFFCWAFEDVHIHGKDTKHQDVSAVDGARSDDLDWAEDSEEEEDSTDLDYHVVLVHDPRDSEAAKFAQDVHCVLQKACGLKTHLPEAGSADFMQKATLDAMDNARHLLFVIGGQEMSPELESYIQHASAQFPETSGKETPSCGVISTLTLDDVRDLPECLLQRGPALRWLDTGSFASQEFGNSGRWVDSVCRLFGFLTGLEGAF